MQRISGYFFKATGFTNKKFEWIFKVCDSFQSYVSTQTFNPTYASHETSEGKYFASEIYNFESSGKIFTEIENSNQQNKHDSINGSGYLMTRIRYPY